MRNARVLTTCCIGRNHHGKDSTEFLTLFHSAYIIVIKDNFGPAMRSIIYASSTSSDSFLYWILGQEFWMTWAVSSLIVLPLCLLRDMTPLASLSLLSNLCMFCIVAIVIYLYAKNPNNEIRHTGQGLYKDWFEVRPGLLDNLGTFVFTFVSQHVVHLAFDSLKPELKTYHHWQRVSSWSLLIAGTVSLSVAIFVYISFWQAAESDIFAIYPAVLVIDTSKILLCMTMLLTFPFPFFTCRELLILTFFQPPVSVATENQDSESNNDLEQSLCDDDAIERATSISFTDLSVISEHAQAIISSALLPNNNKQLKLPYHVSLTVKLWAVVTGLAIAAPSLGDVLDLVGCASGTLIAFIFPAILALRLQGYGHTAMAILITGGLVGSVGTIFSLKKLVQDIFIKAI